ncbi:XRE family transcriptional regulator [uncultured Tateyamaria sp.]|uniref:XRE family transcriptional regulator n=1 Tax=uncultured Tateyamaria sp. TaxID=455651 RepID=UPI00260E4467|nr:XRE family transcriptional regulator [uncultured Tateyamaria sp.]
MRAAIEARGFSEAAISARLGVHKSTFNNWLNDRSEPKFATLLSFCEIVGVDIGSIIKRDTDSPVNLHIDAADTRYAEIECYPFPDADTPDIPIQDPPVAFLLEWLNRSGIDPAHASIIQVADDEMKPTFSEGDLVLVDHRSNRTESKRDVYAVREGDRIILRRLEYNLDGKILVMHSDRHDVPSTFAWRGEQGHYRVIGRVVWLGRKL